MLKVAIHFVFQNVGGGSCRFYYAHNSRTVTDQLKVIGAKEVLSKIKTFLDNDDVIGSWWRNTMLIFTNKQLWHRLLHCSKMIPWDVKTLFYKNCSSRVFHSVRWLSWRGKDIQTTISYVCSELWLCLCTVNINRNKIRPHCLLPVYKTWKTLILPKTKVFVRRILQPLKTWRKPTFCSTKV